MENYSRVVFFPLDKDAENASSVSLGAALRNSLPKIFLEFGDTEGSPYNPSPTFYVSLSDAERIATELPELVKKAKEYYNSFGNYNFFEGEEDQSP